jgi:hypothetical protein
MAAMPLRDEEIEYPTSDGRPMAESNLHRKVMADLIAALEQRYLDDPRSISRRGTPAPRSPPMWFWFGASKNGTGLSTSSGKRGVHRIS